MHVCGIDFGTSNSAIAVGTTKGVTLAPVENDSITLPSAIFYPANHGAAVYGRQAQTLFFESEEGRFMRSLKRLLGTSLMGQGTLINGKIRKFDDILIQFIRHLKQKAEAHSGHEISSVVMGRPVHFVDGDDAGDTTAQNQLEAIAKSAGFRSIAFQFEPIAAAYAHEVKLPDEKLALVVDVGGGTSDFTIIKVGKAHVAKRDRQGDILGNSGGRVGGNDFDKYFSLDQFMPSFGYKTTYGEKNLDVPLSPFHDLSEWSKIHFLYTPRFKQDMRNLYAESHSTETLGRFIHVLEHETGHRVMAQVEDAKIALTEKTRISCDLSFVEKDLCVATDRTSFNKSVAEQMEKISGLLSECLARAQVQADEIEMVILTGGPTEMPVLKKHVQKRFPKAHLSEENKLSSVAMGLGYDSLRSFLK